MQLEKWVRELSLDVACSVLKRVVELLRRGTGCN